MGGTGHQFLAFLRRDLRTARFTRWLHYPVRFVSLAGGRPVENDVRRALG